MTTHNVGPNDFESVEPTPVPQPLCPLPQQPQRPPAYPPRQPPQYPLVYPPQRQQPSPPPRPLPPQSPLPPRPLTPLQSAEPFLPTQFGQYADRLRGVASTSGAAAKDIAARHNIWAIAALAIVGVSPFTAGLLAPLGAILGHIALRQLKTRPEQTGRGMARAAVIIGWTFTFLVPCIALGALLSTFGGVARVLSSVLGLFH
jgi:hypothetical protein